MTPRSNRELFGHGEAEAEWLKRAESGKLAHGWIIAGPKGIGKATLAFGLARYLLSSPWKGEDQGGGLLSEWDPHPNLPPSRGKENIEHRIDTGAHADLLVIEPAFNEKKGEQGTVITVEQAREVGRFLSLKPAEGRWRVVIIDSADALNVNAANAILKVLEEPPPQAVLLLVSHHPGQLLPTIRSRAAMLKLKPLKNEDFNDVLRMLHPEMDYQRRAALHALASGSPGLAVEYEEQGALDMYAEMLDILAALPSPDTLKIHAFCEQLSGAQGHKPFKMFSQLALALFERLGKTAAGIACAPILPAETEILPPLAMLHTPAVWAAKWQQALEQLALAEARHLDYRQVAMIFFHSIAGAEGFVLASAQA